MTHFNYNIKIGHGADILKSGPLAQSINNCGEILITSRMFHDYDECEKSLSGLMSTLSFIEAKLSSNNYVIITKIRPDSETDKDGSWNNCIMRSYIANADALKNKSILAYHVIGQISTDI